MNEIAASAYLAAMIDGEGSVSTGHRIIGNRWPGIRRQVSIANTDQDIIDACLECCTTLGIPHTVDVIRVRHPRYKPCMTVDFHRREAFTRLLRLPIRSTRKRERLEAIVASYRHTPLDAEEMRRLYWDEGLTLQQVAARIGVHYGRVQKAFKTRGIPVRPMSEAVHRPA